MKSPAATTDLNASDVLARCRAQIEEVVFGQREAIELALIGMLSGGHVLIEDVPGTGKSTLARALARTLGLDFRRLQFTSDLLPADVLGVRVFSQTKERFVFRRGPIFTGVLLADELNRTSPRTQSALLEAMGERQVTVDGITELLPEPFFVIATQNPLEFEGTWPLPESQLDRFAVRIELGYPERDAERRVLEADGTDRMIEDLQPVSDASAVQSCLAAARAVRVADEITDYVLSIAAATRTGGAFLHGASPRASLALLRAARGRALLDGRDYCVPDDVKQLVPPVLAHRLVAAPSLDGAAGCSERLLDLLDELPAPR